jgi:hypothetical protein
LQEFVVLGALLKLECRGGILLAACDAIGTGLLPNETGTNAGSGTILTPAGPFPTDVALRIGAVGGDEASTNARAFVISTRALDFINLGGAPHPGEEAVAIDENMVGPKLFGSASLSEDIARFVLGE